jgi:hypothetical protein
LINGIVIGYLNRSPFEVLIAAYMIKKNSAIFKVAKMIKSQLLAVTIVEIKIIKDKIVVIYYGIKGMFLKANDKIGIATARSINEYKVAQLKVEDLFFRYDPTILVVFFLSKSVLEDIISKRKKY